MAAVLEIARFVASLWVAAALVRIILEQTIYAVWVDHLVDLERQRARRAALRLEGALIALAELQTAAVRLRGLAQARTAAERFKRTEQRQ